MAAFMLRLRPGTCRFHPAAGGVQGQLSSGGDCGGECSEVDGPEVSE